MILTHDLPNVGTHVEKRTSPCLRCRLHESSRRLKVGENLHEAVLVDRQIIILCSHWYPFRGGS